MNEFHNWKKFASHHKKNYLQILHPLSLEKLKEKFPIYQRNNILAKKKNMENFHDFFPTKLLHSKFELNLFFGYSNKTQRLHNAFLSYPNPNGNKLIPVMEAFNNLGYHGRCGIFRCVKIYWMFFLVHITARHIFSMKI